MEDDNFQLFNDNDDNNDNNVNNNYNNNNNNNNNNNININSYDNYNINDNNNTIQQLLDDKQLFELNKIKESNYSNCYSVNNYCDININGEWKIGRIKEINEEIITVWDCERKEHEIKAFIFDSEKISYLRKYTKINASRLPIERSHLKELHSIKSFIENLINFNFGNNQTFEKNFGQISAYRTYHNLRGKLYLWFDNVLNINNNNEGIDLCIQIFLLILKLIKNYYDYLKNNNDIVIKYKEIKGTELEDIVLIDRKYAIISFEEDAQNLYSKIYGLFPKYNDFYLKYSKEIQQVISSLYNKDIKKICKNDIYKGQISFFRVNDEQKIPLLPITFLIDYFNSINGYQVLSDYIVCNSNFTIEYIYDFILLFKRVYNFLEQSNDEFLNKFSQIKDYLKKRIMNLSENEIKKLSTNDLVTVFQRVSSISTFNNQIQQNIFHELYLNYLFSCLKSNNLKKQIQSINIFNSIIVNNDKSYQKFMDKNVTIENDKKIENITHKTFINILNDLQILDFILENKVNEEILKRSFLIIMFMYKNNFNLKDLEIETILTKRKNIIDCLFQKLFNAEKNNEINLLKIIKNLIAQLAKFIVEDDRIYTFKLIKQFVGNRELTKDNINFIKEFTINYLSEFGNQINYNHENINNSDFKEEIYYGIPLLWNYMLDDYYIKNPFSNKLMIVEIIETCVNSLKEIFNIKIINENLGNLVLNKIIENLNSNHSEVQTLLLLNSLFSINPNYILLLQNINIKKNTISDLIVDNLNNYYNKVYSNDKYKQKKNDDISNIIFQGFYPHSRNTEIRIELIITLLNKNIDIEINFTNFIKLWNSFVKDNISKEFFIKNLRTNINNISYNFKSKLFQLIFLKNDLFKIDNLESFRLFKDLMLDINYSNNSLIQIYESNFLVKKADPNQIIGFTKLMDALIYTQNLETQKEISLLLTNICLNIINPKSKEAVTFWTNFINKISEYLINNENGIKGLILLINTIEKNIGLPGEIINDFSQTFSIELNIPKDEIMQYIFSYNQNTYKLNISFNEPFYMIRYKISNHFQIPVNTIQFQLNLGKNLIYSFDLCDDYQLFNRLILNSNKKVSPKNTINITVLTIQNPIINCPNNPKELLKSSQFQQTFLKLLKHKNKNYCLDIWHILKKDVEKHNDLNIKIKKYITEKNVSSELKKEIDNIFQFNDVSSCYINYLLLNLITILNQNKDNKIFIDLLIKNDIWVKKVLLFIKNYSVKIKDVEEYKQNKEKLQMLRTIKFLFELFKLITSDIDNLIIEKSLQFINDIFYNSTVFKNEGNIYENQSTIIDIILNFISGNKKIFIKLIENILNGNQNKQFLNILIPGIIESKNTLLKDNYIKFIRILFDYDLFDSKNHDLEIKFINFLIQFLFSDKVLNQLNDISVKNEDLTFEPFFDIYEKIINKAHELKVNFDFKEFGNKILPEIVSNQVREGLLSGYFLIIYSIIKNYSITFDKISGQKFDFPNFLFYKILFSKCIKDPLNSNTITVKNKSTFLIASDLLTLLIINNEVKRKEILTQLYNFHELQFWKSSRLLDWKLSFDERKNQFVGLKNLGNTCYMNSLFQVLFSNIKFRESILNTECKIEEKNVLYQLKYLFNSLKFINSKYFIPVDFAKNFDNEELNVREQMDVDEFFNLFIDKLENHLKNTNNANLIKHFFQGKNYDNLIFQKCNHKRKNEVSFYSIQLQIKNKKNLFESLDAYIESELMENENSIICESCHMKIPSKKNQTFKTLPRILLFVLKRIEFDYYTMTKTKINDYYEFPLSFDMTNYTDDYLNNNRNIKKVNNNYKLKSIVVHSGDSNKGHYYSFIYDNNSNEWYEFNDISVEKFDINNLKKETFGGFEFVFNEKTKKNEKVEINKNAYLLFYEKDDESNCEKFNDVHIYNEISNNIKEDSICKKINENIFQYNIQKIIFSTEYHRFILQFLVNFLSLSFNNRNEFIISLQNLTRTKDEKIVSKDILRLRNTPIGSNLNNYIEGGTIKLIINDNSNKKQPNDNISMIFQFLLLYFFNVFVRAKEKTYLGGNVDLIKFFLNKYNECSEFLIEEFCDIKTLMEYLVNCPITEMKKLFVGIIYCAMIKIYETHNENLNNNKNENQNKKNNDLAFYNINALDSNDISKSERSGSSMTLFFSNYNDKKNSNSKTVIIKNNKDDSKRKGSFDLELNNHLEAIHIPKILLKFINNVIFLIQKISDDIDCMFLYYVLYRFAHIDQFCKAYLVVKIPFLKYLIYHLLPKYADKLIPSNYSLDFDLKVMDCEHNILAPMINNQVGNTISKDKSAIYRKESYINMLLFELLYSGFSSSKIDKTYQFNKLDFVLDLFSIVRTKQDAFCLSKLINKMCIDNQENTKNFINAFMTIIENKDSIELDNYMIIFKRFIVNINDKDQDNKNFRIKNTLNSFFKLIFKYDKVYSHCDYCILFTINIFLSDSKKMFSYVDNFKNIFEKMKEWYEHNPIPPSMYPIEGLKMYKFQHNNNQQEEINIDINLFKEKSIRYTKRNINLIEFILNSKIII